MADLWDFVFIIIVSVIFIISVRCCDCRAVIQRKTPGDRVRLASNLKRGVHNIACHRRNHHTNTKNHETRMINTM